MDGCKSDLSVLFGSLQDERESNRTGCKRNTTQIILSKEKKQREKKDR